MAIPSLLLDREAKARCALKAAADLRVLAECDVRQKMIEVGSDPAGNTPEEFVRFIRNDQAKWAKPVKEAGIAVE